MKKMSLVMLIVGVALFIASADLWAGVSPSWAKIGDTIYITDCPTSTAGTSVPGLAIIDPITGLILQADGKYDGSFVVPAKSANGTPLPDQANYRVYAQDGTNLGTYTVDSTKPIAVAGSDQGVPYGGEAVLNGSGLDPLGPDVGCCWGGWFSAISGVASYQWTDSSGNPIGAGGNDPTARVFVSAGMKESFFLTVTDAVGNVSAPDEMVVSDITFQILSDLLDVLPPGLLNPNTSRGGK